MIKVQNISKVYGFKPVLREISFDVAAGEFVALLGANGAGKTTLLRIVSTLLKPTAGQVTVGGWILPQQASAVRGLLGMISHNPLLYTDLTAAENLQLYARLYGLANGSVHIDEVLEQVGLYPRRNELVRNFSRGMQQRLAIGRALLHGPRVMLCDEPHTGLDQQAGEMLDQVLRSVAASGCTVLMTTHDLRRGVALADRVLILSRGRLAFDQPSTGLNLDGFAETFAEVTGG